MAHISVSVNGRSYMLACDDGEEEHLRRLAGYLDNHIQDLSASIGPVGETRLLLMAGLMVTDELAGAIDKITKLETELTEAKERQGEPGARFDALETSLTETIEKAAGRLEGLAKALKDRQTSA